MVHRVRGIKKATDAISDASRAVTTLAVIAVVAMCLGVIAVALSAYALMMKG